MAVPVRQSVKVGAYIARQRLARRDKYALVLELEPLYQCNLACAGCGKIQHPDHVLRRRMPVEDAVAAVEECGAPVGSIAGVEQTRRLFKAAFADGRRRHWRLNHSPLFLDFLEGRTDFKCTAWGIPSYSIFGWQRPCYLLADGYASSYRELLEGTDWEQYGRGRDPRCDNCMAHCGYEPTAVNESLRAPHKALLSTLRDLRS